MKLVTYVIKEDELNVQSTNVAGARLGWWVDDWIVDIMFAQQWLVTHQRIQTSHRLPAQFQLLLQQGDTAFSLLYELYELINQEHHSRLVVEGEPVALLIDDVQLLSPFLQSQPVLYVDDQQKQDQLWVQPWVDHAKPIPQSIGCYPAIACLIKKKGTPMTKDQALEHIAGFCLINFWQMQGVWFASTSPSVVTMEEVAKQPYWSLEFRHQGVINQRTVPLLEQFGELLVKQSKQAPLSPGDILSMGWQSIDVPILVEEQMELRLEHLGQLENRVDKR